MKRYITENNVQQIITEAASWILDIVAIEQLKGGPVPVEVVVKEKLEGWIDNRLKMSMIHQDEVIEEYGRECFYDGREIERYNENGLAIFKHPTYNGYLREMEKKFK